MLFNALFVVLLCFLICWSDFYKEIFNFTSLFNEMNKILSNLVVIKTVNL